MFVHYVRGECWWYDSRGWTFPPIFCYILLLSNRWQQRCSLTKWHLTFMSCKSVSLNFSMQKKNCTHGHSSTLAECLWRPHSVYRHTRWWVVCFSNGNSDVKDKPHFKQLCRFLQAWHAGSCSSLANAELVVLTMLKNSSLYLRMCSNVSCYCSFCICCSFCGIK